MEAMEEKVWHGSLLNRLFATAEGHPNLAGHRIVAREVAEKILKTETP